MSRKKYQEPANSFGARLRHFREEMDLSGEEMALLLEVSSSSLSAYELNKSSPKLDFFAALMQKTTIDIRWLLTGEQDLYNKDTDLERRLARAEAELAALREAMEKRRGRSMPRPPAAGGASRRLDQM